MQDERYACAFSLNSLVEQPTIPRSIAHLVLSYFIHKVTMCELRIEILVY